MTTVLHDHLEAGDVIEIDLDGALISALVLLAAETAVIIDPCDGSTPLVIKRDELTDYRKFDPAL